ncbi:MAG: hypothetical protein AAF512_11365, partial [Pseudomonadota bacterium]
MKKTIAKQPCNIPRLNTSSLALAVSTALALGAQSLHAATITVDAGAVDNDNGSGNCSLIEAIQAANSNIVIDNCAAGDEADSGGDIIVLPNNSTF